jgi:hypothetical protein
MARALMSACSNWHVLWLVWALCGTCSDWFWAARALIGAGSVWHVLWLACWLASCGTTSSTFVLMSTFTWWSMHGKSKWRPDNRWTHCQNEVMTTSITGARKIIITDNKCAHCKVKAWQQAGHSKDVGLTPDGHTVKKRPDNIWTHCQNEVMTTSTTGAYQMNYWQAHCQNKGLTTGGRTVKMK